MSQPSTATPADLSFTVDFPSKISLAYEEVAYIYVENIGGDDAKNVYAVVNSNAIIAYGDPVDVIKKGKSDAIQISVKAKDVQDGLYTAQIQLKYSDKFGTHTTKPKEVYFYLIPYATFTDVKIGYYSLFPPLFISKKEIGRNDNTKLYFKILSKSEKVIYRGLRVKANFSIDVPGLSISPPYLEIEDIGPNGKTKEYHFEITSNGAPPGKYTIIISLYSKDNQLIEKRTLELVVKP